MEMKIIGQGDEQEQHFHVLAVDDSILDRKVLERLLRVSSYQVTSVESGDKALEYLGLQNELENPSSSSSSSSCSTKQPHQQGSKVNLIMTDYCMPGMSGYDLLKRLKDSSWKDIPVVVMSSENIPARITQCLEGGAEEFLLKPLKLADLKQLQARLFRSFQKTDEASFPKKEDEEGCSSSDSSCCKRQTVGKRKTPPFEGSAKRRKLVLRM